MIWLYRIAFLPFLLLALPYYLRRMIRRGGYRHDFHHRFGLIDRPPKKGPGVRRIWIQAVSVGEIQAVTALVEQLNGEPDVEIILTTTTSTGYAILRERFSTKVCKVGIFPLDFAPFSKNAWRRLDPDVSVLMESELWPEHLHQAARRGVPVILINARLSDRSFRRYQKLKPLAQRLLQGVDQVLASSEQDRERFIALGHSPEKTLLSGNLKFDGDVGPPLDPVGKEALRGELGFITSSGNKPLVILGSSTWPGEEILLLDVMQKARTKGVDCRLLLVPRHAERRNELMPWLSQSGQAYHVRSQGLIAGQSVTVCLADTTGELAKLTQVADIAFIGKSLPPHEGGQTPIEAAAWGLPIVYGPAMSNFRQVCQSLEKNQAAIRIENEAALSESLLRLINDEALRKRMGDNAKQWHLGNRGATERTAAVLLKYQSHHHPVGEPVNGRSRQ